MRIAKILLVVLLLLVASACREEPETKVAPPGGPATPAAAGTPVEPPAPTLRGVALLPSEAPDLSRLEPAELTRIELHARAARVVDLLRSGPPDAATTRLGQLIFAILDHPKRVPTDLVAKVRAWANLLIAHQAVVDRQTGRRIDSRMNPGELAAAAHGAVLGGAKLPVEGLEGLEALLAELRPVVFSERPAADADAGVDGGPVPASGPALPAPSGYDDARRLLASGVAALPADRRSAPALGLAWLERGQPGDRVAYERALAADPATVQTVMIRGTPDGEDPDRIGVAVLVRDARREARFAALARHAVALEAGLPVGEASKRTAPDPRRPSPRPWIVLAAGGLLGPATPAGIALGTTRFVLAEQGLARERLAAKARIAELAVSPESAGRQLACLEEVHEAELAVRELVGRPAGRATAKLRGWRPEELLADTHPVLEAARVELVTLFLAADPRLVELGILTRPECALAWPERFAGQLVAGLAREPASGPTIEDRARWLVARRLTAAGAMKIELRPDGRLVAAIPDHARLHQAAGELLAEVQRVIFEGDVNGARELTAAWDRPVEAAWRLAAQKRWRRLGLPRLEAFLYPVLEPRRDERGTLLELRATIPGDLVAPHLNPGAP